MEFLVGLLAFLVMLSLIVLIHEAGHFAAAKKFGVYVHEFSLGMGPALYQKKGKETTFSIRAIPFGGYVLMAGETGEEPEEGSWMEVVPKDRYLSSKKTWQQVVVMAAGVCMNVLLAAVLFMGLAMASQYEVQSKPVVESVVAGMPAEEAGLLAGDEIIKITNTGGEVLPQSQRDVSLFLNMYPETSTFTVKRNGSETEVEITPVKDEDGTWVVGYTSAVQLVPLSFWGKVRLGFADLADSASMIFKTFGMLAKGRGYENLSGPVGILDVTTQTAKMGLMAYLSLFAMISLNIGIFNLLPIPALDGGRIVILLLERGMGRKINTKLLENVIMASFLLLVGLLLFASYNDIMRMFF